MTISHVEPVKTYVSSGNGAYPFTFKILAESDIEVWYTSALTGARVQLVRGSDFSVTISDPGGTVTILGNAPAGGQILIQRRVPIDQPTNWVNNGPFDMDLLEADLDRIIMIAQQLHWDVSTGQAAINYRGPWVTPVEYAERDIVRTVNGNYYFCVVSHTSGTFSTDLAAGNWVLLIDFEAIETHATNAAASAADALASRNTAIARSAAAELSEIAAAASATAAAADADEIRDWPVSTGLATDVAEHLAFSRKNLLINGGFDVWQDGTSFADSLGMYTADMWFKVVTSATFLVDYTYIHGQEEGLTNCMKLQPFSCQEAILLQRVEGLQRFSNKTVTLSFWAKSDDPEYMSVEFVANFGTGGTPSTAIQAIGVTKVATTASWAKYTVTAALPSMLASTFGTNNDSSLDVNFWYSASPVLDLRTGVLGQQNGVFYLSNVQLEFGDAATDFEYRHPAEELALCQRYYEKGVSSIPKIFNQLTSTSARSQAIQYKVTKRVTPTCVVGSFTPSGHAGTPGALTVATTTDEFVALAAWTDGIAGRAFSGLFTWTADARL